MKYIIIIILLTLTFSNCKNQKESEFQYIRHESNINCYEKDCQGIYVGVEFKDGSDVAHQFSNKMSKHVGDKLKELYREGKYSQVNLGEIEMSTQGMGTGEVHFKLRIPFTRVQEKCEAYTSFDHVGGWNHKPALEKRKKELESALMKDEILLVSDLKTTKEGLQEYWIQWKNKITQAECL